MQIFSVSLGAATLGAGVIVAAASSAPDWQGIAGFVTAAGVFIIGVGGFIVSAILQLRMKDISKNQGVLYEKQSALEKQQIETHDLVNGVAGKLRAKEEEVTTAKVDLSYLEGEKAGIKAERKDPQMPATIVDETVLTKEKELPEAKDMKFKTDELKKPKRRAKK